MHSSGAQPVPPNVRKKRPELGSDRDRLCRLHSPGVSSAPSSPTAHVRACTLPLFVWRESVSCENVLQKELSDIFVVLTVFVTYCLYILQVLLSWHHQDKDVVVVAMLWQDPTFIKNVPVAGTKN